MRKFIKIKILTIDSEIYVELKLQVRIFILQRYSFYFKICHEAKISLSHFIRLPPITPFKAMDQPGHVTRFLLYRNLSLYNPISTRIKKGNCKFVEFNKIY